MDTAHTGNAFSLRWKILAWFFVNLAVLGALIFLFLRVQFHVGINSLLAGPTDDRLEAIARPLAAELSQRPSAEWSAALDRAMTAWRKRGVRAALYRGNGRFVNGDFPAVPPEVLQALDRVERHPPGPPGGRGGHHPPGDDRPDHGPMDFLDLMAMSGDGNGGPPRPSSGGNVPDDRLRPLRGASSAAPLEKFMLVSNAPRLYWAGVSLGEWHVGGMGRGGGPPSTLALLLASDSLRGGGLFFDYTPWLLLGGGLVLVSVLLWLPFVHGLTRALARMTRTAEQIAQGRFDPPHPLKRRDELGRLNRALGHMAVRLDGYVSGQKRFLGDTAHELLSPLARLEVALSILEHQGGPADGNSYVGQALEEMRHISALVHDLLSFTKAGMRSPAALLPSVPLADMARQAVAREAAEEKVSVEVADDLQVCAEPDLLVRALANAVRNALRYAGDAGRITITAKPATRGDDGAETVALTVADEGPGVPPETLGRLFDPFFRPETARTRETGGVGLGLAIVKSCVEACGGRVAVRNREPHGLELIFTLQRAA